MANEPVQVVLNPGALRAPRDRPTPNGNGTDFFAGRNTAFATHRMQLAAAVSAVIAALENDQQFAGLGYVRVVMAADAIAKSHRAQRRLFRPAWTPHVATEGIGEPIYAVTPQSLRKVLAEIVKAETDVPLKIDSATGLAKPNPSRNRCEVSAIESITLWTDQDKRDFSAADGAAWLARSGTGGRYLIELFPVATAEDSSALAHAELVAFDALRTGLAQLSVDVQALRAGMSTGVRELSLKVNVPGTPSRLSLEPPSVARARAGEVEARSSSEALVAVDPGAHQRVLESIERNPLVRSVSLPPVVRRDLSEATSLGTPVAEELFERDPETASAQVGVVDGGVGEVIGEWVEDRWGQLADDDRDVSHGTFISGLLVAAGSLNPFLHTQTHGCRIYDLDVLPSDPGETGIPFDNYYPGGVPDFMDEVETAVADYRQRHGVRVFNFSMNFHAAGDSSRYGYAAMRLDQIAAQNDVIFVISAGNLLTSQQRPEWSVNSESALASLANDTQSILSEPGESLHNVSVSALNPPGLEGQVPLALARYSRRGPGLRGATKPDFAHIGGSGSPRAGVGAGLFSVDELGQLVAGAGTSYAAPLVARRLADLDALIEGEVSREVLLALLVHYAHTPDVFAQKTILPVARNLIGFGVPTIAEEMLQRDDSEITLVFDSVVQPGEQATLKFAWPEALVGDGGKCRGYARLTLIARPQLAYEHGDERIRVNIGARLMQENKDGGFESRLHAVNMTPSGTEPRTERDLLKEAMKWQVAKCFEAKLTGRGPSSTWKFVVNYLTRADESMPMNGVEFAAVLTIADPRGIAPVFQQMRLELGQLGIRTDDIRTSIRARAQA
ncbi:S8 family serine peptidase [Parafrigoribacterium humi]|uniref:S8 family serine peptidase n=1 Tax=Parafrigoribacterium humi TaxID=3144664 RepID=UPI0032EC73C3